VNGAQGVMKQGTMRAKLGLLAECRYCGQIVTSCAVLCRAVLCCRCLTSWLSLRSVGWTNTVSSCRAAGMKGQEL